tara:strand:+ start:64 stop:288 length:225 start_codon:yes stop_codon:yes gene_type:complete
MSRVNLNTKDNSMADGKKSIRNFYEEIIVECIKNKGKVTEYGTIINEDFISVLLNRLNKLNEYTLNSFNIEEIK